MSKVLNKNGKIRLNKEDLRVVRSKKHPGAQFISIGWDGFVLKLYPVRNGFDPSKKVLEAVKAAIDEHNGEVPDDVQVS